MTTERVLFLCSGNYFRSRFAEILFNHHCRELALPMRADSAGLLMENDNPGNLSIYTRSYAETMGWAVPERPPQGATQELFDWATRVVAVKEAEHRAPIEQRFSADLPKVEFWQIDDEDVRAPHEILPDLEATVMAYLTRLQATLSPTR